jgi:hypothetical protein
VNPCAASIPRMLHPEIKRRELGKVINLFTAIIRLIPGKHDKGQPETQLVSPSPVSNDTSFLFGTNRDTIRALSCHPQPRPGCTCQVCFCRCVPNASNLVDRVYLDAFEHVPGEWLARSGSQPTPRQTSDIG